MTTVTEFLEHTRKRLPLPRLPYPLNSIKGITGVDEDCILQIARQCGGLKIPHAHDAVVVWLTNDGMNINEISEELQLSEDTVRGYLNGAEVREEIIIKSNNPPNVPVTQFFLPKLPSPLDVILKIINKARDEEGRTDSEESDEDAVLLIAQRLGGRQIPHAHNVLTVLLWNQDKKIEDIARELRISKDIVCGYLNEAGLKNAEEFVLEPHILWNIKRKSAATAYLTAFFGGLFGIHRFYLGKNNTASYMLFSGCCFPFFFMIGIWEQDSSFVIFGLVILLVLLVVLARDLIFLNDMVEKRNKDLAKEIWE